MLLERLMVRSLIRWPVDSDISMFCQQN